MFRRMDDSGNKVLEFEEFHKGIIETGLKGVSEDDAREMFNHFDKDGGGTVNIDEFLMAIRVGTLILPHKSSKVQKHLYQTLYLHSMRCPTLKKSSNISRGDMNLNI